MNEAAGVLRSRNTGELRGETRSQKQASVGGMESCHRFRRGSWRCYMFSVLLRGDVNSSGTVSSAEAAALPVAEVQSKDPALPLGSNGDKGGVSMSDPVVPGDAEFDVEYDTRIDDHTIQALLDGINDVTASVEGEHAIEELDDFVAEILAASTASISMAFDNGGRLVRFSDVGYVMSRAVSLDPSVLFLPL